MSTGRLLFKHSGQRRGAGDRRGHERRLLEPETAAEGRMTSEGGSKSKVNVFPEK